MYSTLFGGIEAFSTEHFQLINGFSNQFFGWGGEDDNLYDRCLDFIKQYLRTGNNFFCFLVCFSFCGLGLK